LNSIVNITNIDEAWLSWKTEFLRLCDKHAPVKVCRLKDRFKPWITSDIVKLMYKRDYLHKQAVKRCDINLMNEYRGVKTEIQWLIQQSKKAYYDNLCKEANSKPKVLWNELKMLSGKSRNVTTYNDSHTAGNFNEFFANVGKITTQHLSVPDDVMWLGASSIYEFKFEPISESSVCKLLKCFGSSSSLDILTFDCKLLKLSAEYIAPSLTLSI
jgi:hypothetical protein